MTSNGTLSAPVALVTGGASGMGLSTVERLVELGWNVCIADMNAEMGKKHAARLGDKAFFVQVDVRDYEQQAAAFVQTWKKWARLDFVFANAVCMTCIINP